MARRFIGHSSRHLQNISNEQVQSLPGASIYIGVPLEESPESDEVQELRDCRRQMAMLGASAFHFFCLSFTVMILTLRYFSNYNMALWICCTIGAADILVGVGFFYGIYYFLQLDRQIQDHDSKQKDEIII
jgi:hypothetical protein